MLKISGKAVALLLFTAVLLSGCRGYRSEKPAIHLNPNMDVQAKITAQTLPLTPPEHTQPWGNEYGERADYLPQDIPSRIPVPVDRAMLERGQNRFDIYCAACHDRTGAGNGSVVQKGFTPPPNLSDTAIVALSDGEIYSIISDGIRTMPGHAKQIPAADRWAIVSYVRALQKMNTATLQDVPIDQRSYIQP